MSANEGPLGPAYRVLYQNADADSNLFLKKGDLIQSPIVYPNLGIQSSATNPAGSGVIGIDGTDSLALYSDNEINLYPDGNQPLGISFNAGLVAGIAQIGPIGTGASLQVQASPGFNVAQASSTSGVGVGYAFLGALTQISVTGASTVLSFIFGNNQNPVVAGAVCDFVVDIASSTPGAQVQFIQGGVTKLSYTVQAGVNKFIRMVCDGTNWFPVTF